MRDFLTNFVTIIIFVVILLSCIKIYQWNSRKKTEKKRIEDEERRLREAEEKLERNNRTSLLRDLLPLAYQVRDEYSRLSSFSTGYFSDYQMRTWTEGAKELLDKFSNINLNQTDLAFSETRLFRWIRAIVPIAEERRSRCNGKFIDAELKKNDAFFSDMEGRSLDIQQRRAIVTDENNSLVIAGAGSGKTATIVGKIKYLQHRLGVGDNEILLLSFTRKSAEDLKSRTGYPAYTFHSFGKQLIERAGRRRIEIFDPAHFGLFLDKTFTSLLKDGDYLNQVLLFFSEYFKEVKTPFDFTSQEEHIQYLKDSDIKPLKPIEVEIKGKITIQKEVVKSVEECRIANYFFLNNIRYQYEYPYEFDTEPNEYKKYKPDFTILSGENKIYLEHLAFDRNGEVPKWFASRPLKSAKEIYTEGADWKRSMHEANGTVLLETYSYEMKEGILFSNLAENLAKYGIFPKPKSPTEVWTFMRENHGPEIKKFLELIATFITLMKSNNYSLEDVMDKAGKDTDNFNKERNLLLLKIIAPILEAYQRHLAEKELIDFSEMINNAATLVRQGTFPIKFRYIIVDEFQDLSIGRYNLLKALKETNPACRLFCVGDDWQSIYRFTGSDIALFRDFSQYFGATEMLRIENTYRFNEPVLSISSTFILKNPNQTGKNLRSPVKDKATQIEIVYGNGSPWDCKEPLVETFLKILGSEPGIQSKSLLVLGRYSHDYNTMARDNQEKQLEFYKESINKPGEPEIVKEMISYNGPEGSLSAEFLTVHRSKGLEADIVIVINCNAGKFGFPSAVADDNALNLLLSSADQFENGEERRLFYVALTRAKEKVYIITDSNNKSKFIRELEIGRDDTSLRKCPVCRTADLVLLKKGKSKNNDLYWFYKCSNDKYGCEYMVTEFSNGTKKVMRNGVEERALY